MHSRDNHDRKRKARIFASSRLLLQVCHDSFVYMCRNPLYKLGDTGRANISNHLIILLFPSGLLVQKDDSMYLLLSVRREKRNGLVLYWAAVASLSPSDGELCRSICSPIPLSLFESSKTRTSSFNACEIQKRNDVITPSWYLGRIYACAKSPLCVGKYSVLFFVSFFFWRKKKGSGEMVRCASLHCMSSIQLSKKKKKNVKP